MIDSTRASNVWSSVALVAVRVMMAVTMTAFVCSRANRRLKVQSLYVKAFVCKGVSVCESFCV